MLKKITTLLFSLLFVFVPSVSVFAYWSKVQEGGHYEKETEVGKVEDLWGAKSNDQSPGKTSTSSPRSSSSGSSGNSSGSSSGSNSGGGSSPVIVEKEIRLLEIKRTPTERTHVEEKTLYWEWKVVSGPGSMTVHSSDRKVEQVGGIWRAGQRVMASFSAAGTYTVQATEVREKTTTVTPVTIVERRYFIKEYIRTNPSTTSWNEVRSYFRTTRGEEYGTPTVKKDLIRRQPVTYTVRVIEPNKPGLLPPDSRNLQTTSRVIFSREYVYTDDIIDAITDKGFELEVIYDFTANTTIKEIFIPVHTITRYQNMGTMTITPVDWSWSFYNGNKSVRIWAKFKYPKAAVPGRSPMLFRVRVNTKDGTRVVSDQIDVPVNTLNGRFTDVPESETGELYPIKGLYKVNNREYLKDFGTTIYHAIYVP